MLIWKKVTSGTLALFLLGSFNFCLVECTFASEHEDRTTQMSGGAGHHHESDDDHDRSGPDQHDAGSLCCSSLVAVESFSSYTTDFKILKDPLFYTVVLEKIFLRPNASSQYEVEFPPGASPPSAFLLNHFTHAPPAFF